MLNAALVPGEVAQAAQKLCRCAVTAILPCAVSGNNRVYYVTTTGGRFAMKCYGPRDEHDRLGHEFNGLSFLKAAGVERCIPAALAVDRTSHSALYEWIDGDAVAVHGVAEIASLLDLLGALHSVRAAADAPSVASATEAVVCGAELLGQLDKRLGRLQAAAQTQPALGNVLADVKLILGQSRESLEDQTAQTPLPRDAQTLSPSDTGFHNALRRFDGSLCFVDFEYFGWDDPVKLTADVLWHPAVALSVDQRRAFVAGAMRLYGRGDEHFAQRLAHYYPLFGIRWALIMLNAFVPSLRKRREFAGSNVPLEDVKRVQLRKAQAALERVRRYTSGTYDR